MVCHEKQDLTREGPTAEVMGQCGLVVHSPGLAQSEMVVTQN